MQEVNNKNSYTYRMYRSLVRADSIRALIFLAILLVSLFIDLVVYFFIPNTYWYVIFLEVMALVLIKNVDIYFSKRLKNHYYTWGRGAGSELVTQKKLQELGHEYRVVNDFQYRHGNIDHICIGPTGIFTIETKSHKGVISYNGKRLLRNGKDFDKDFLKQSKGAAFYISDYIFNKTNRKYFVAPILIFNNAKINDSIRGRIEGVWIGGRGFQNYVIKRSRNYCLSRKEVDFIFNIINNDLNNYHKEGNGNVNNELMIACFSGRVGIVKELIEHGGDIDASDSYGKTPLMLACYNGHIEIIKMLIDKGVNVNKRNEYGWTALTYAQNDGYDEIATILKNAGGIE